MYDSNTEKGYIALMSAIIISLLLLSITLGIGFSSIFSRFNVLDSESKERSLALAEACVNTAILKLSGNQSYALVVADHVTPVGSDTCNIVSLSPSPPRNFPITIQTQACINKSVTNLIAIIDDTFRIISFQELPNFSPNVPCP